MSVRTAIAPGAACRPGWSLAAPPGPGKRTRAAATRLAVAAVLALLALAAGCAGPSGLVRLERPPVELRDDGTTQTLLRAVDQSIRYYLRLPDDATFTYGEETYTAAEMISSHLLFRSLLLSAPDPETFRAEMAERFRFYESVAPEGNNLFTGYFEPVIAASETPTGELDTPLYARPENMVEVPLQQFDPSLPPRTLVGRVDGDRLVPFYTREEIQQQAALDPHAEPIAYVDQVDLFFLQIQGSGMLRFQDGRELKVGYVGSNGHPYRSIGAVLLRREALTREEMSLQTIREYLRANPDEVESLLYKNPSYTFFQVRPEGPLGNIAVPLTAGRSLALDRRLFPKGGLAYVVTEAPLPFDPEATRPLQRFMVVQDTGGAIRGHGRGDIFWGNGPEAEWIAGHQKHGGRLLLLVARKKYLMPFLATAP